MEQLKPLLKHKFWIIFGIALLASAAADRSVKIWKVDDGTRPHPRSFGTFPRKIGRYAIREKVLSLPMHPFVDETAVLERGEWVRARADPGRQHHRTDHALTVPVAI